MFMSHAQCMTKFMKDDAPLSSFWYSRTDLLQRHSRVVTGFGSRLTADRRPIPQCIKSNPDVISLPEDKLKWSALRCPKGCVPAHQFMVLWHSI